MKTQVAEIYYHINDRNKQKIVVDADKVKGEILFPELIKKRVDIRDARDSEVVPSFSKDSFEFLDYPSQITSFDVDDFKKVYDYELESLIKEKLDAKEVIVFDHTIREENSSVRPPARHAHVDYSKKSADEQVRKYIDKYNQKHWLEGHYAIINIWRPIQNKIQSAPLGFLLPSTMSDDELIEIDLIYPERIGEVLGALFKANHRWIYLSEMKPSEIVLFNMFDNQGKKPVVHSAFDLEGTKMGAIRKSIESRILVRF